MNRRATQAQVTAAAAAIAAMPEADRKHLAHILRQAHERRYYGRYCHVRADSRAWLCGMSADDLPVYVTISLWGRSQNKQHHDVKVSIPGTRCCLAETRLALLWCAARDGK